VLRFPVALSLAALCAFIVGTPAVARRQAPTPPTLTPVPCPAQEWQDGDASFEALPGAKAVFGKYDGGIYRIEIPAKWNGELMLSAHGFVPNAGRNGSMRRVANPLIRQHLIEQEFAGAASSEFVSNHSPEDNDDEKCGEARCAGNFNSRCSVPFRGTG
jgi:hypothetical protein